MQLYSLFTQFRFFYGDNQTDQEDPKRDETTRPIKEQVRDEYVLKFETTGLRVTSRDRSCYE